jgi:hypothetical protein
MYLKLAIIFFLVTTLSGCLFTPTKMYEGAELSDDDVAIIIGMNPKDPLIPKGWGAYITTVDGKATPDKGARIAVLPGEHALKVNCYAPGLESRFHFVTQTFEAGATYGIGVPHDSDECLIYKK